MILAAHQIDFFPYSGFWHKMAMADLFDVDIDTQFQKGYVNNRTMIGSGCFWWGVPVEQHLAPLRTIRLRTEEEVKEDWRACRLKRLHQEYKDAPYFSKYFPEVEAILMTRYRLLWELNFAALLFVKRALGIQTPVCIGRPLKGQKTDALIDLCQMYGVETYLSGVGGKDYVDVPKMGDHGIKVQFSDHEPTYRGSVLHLLFTDPRPMDTIMRRKSDG